MNLEQHKITSYEDNVKDLPDYPSDAGITAKELKAIFDGRSDKEIKQKFNALIDELITTLEAMRTEISGKVEKYPGKGLSSNDFTEDYRIMLENADMAAADAGNEIYFHKEDKENPHNVTAEQVGTYSAGEIDVFVSDLGNIADEVAALQSEIEGIKSNKVDREEGKGLSSNDFTDEWKNDINFAVNESIMAEMEIAGHSENKDNPHDVTAEQIGAVTREEASEIAYNTYVASDDHQSLLSDVRTLQENQGDIDAALDAILEIQNAYINEENKESSEAET
ncbi:MAG: hypothetical protein IJN97_02765 [Oscillospiraceae bacterium]|nr:hypothetical protein [Oscillospiraceae bacterium]